MKIFSHCLNCGKALKSFPSAPRVFCNRTCYTEARQTGRVVQPSRKLTNNQEEAIITRYQTQNVDGTWTGAVTIATEYGVTPACIYSILGRHGIARRPPSEAYVNGKRTKPITHLPIGDPPTCKCGCSELTDWNQHKNRWNIYSTGHYHVAEAWKSQERRCPTCRTAFIPDHPGKSFCSSDCERTTHRTPLREVTVDPAFGHWLAGIIDGEGCFTLTAGWRSRRQYYQPRFSIGLRDDDGAVMNYIQTNLDTRAITYRCRAYKTTRPQYQLDLSSLSDCLVLISILDQYPLRSKKQHAYAIWREAVMLRKKGLPTSHPCFAQLYERIRDANTYHPPD